MILFTVSQAAIYANVTKSAVVHWVVQGYLPREEAEYGIWIDPDQLDVILKTRAKFSPRFWPDHIEEVREAYEFGKVVTFTTRNSRILPYRSFITKSGLSVKAIKFYGRFRVISDKYVATSSELGGWLVRFKFRGRVHLRILDKLTYQEKQ